MTERVMTERAAHPRQLPEKILRYRARKAQISASLNGRELSRSVWVEFFALLVLVGADGTHILRLSEDLPIVIECVDTTDKIESVLPALDDMIGDGLITIERADSLR